MDNNNLYYQAPEDSIFNELKTEALKIWRSYEHPSYVEEKVSRIQDLQNVSDNFMYIFAMFDFPNQMKLTSHLSEDTKTALRARLIAGGTGVEWIRF